MDIFYKICILLIIVGGINWGLIGFLNFDLVAWLFGGSTTFLARSVYGLVGIGAICSIPTLFSDIK